VRSTHLPVTLAKSAVWPSSTGDQVQATASRASRAWQLLAQLRELPGCAGRSLPSARELLARRWELAGHSRQSPRPFAEVVHAFRRLT
jgi:hypothetical protein